MKKNAFRIFLVAGIALLTTTACNKKKKTTSSSSSSNITLQSSSETPHKNIRLNLNSVHIAHAADQFQGGTTLEQLKNLFGEPSKSDQVPSGNATLDLYTWTFDKVIVTVQLFQDSTIARSISNFTFIRDATITSKKYNQLTNGLTYEQVVSILGEPDNLAQSASSDSENMQAVWNSGIKSKISNPYIELTFVNNSLTNKNQAGLN